jgi:hypothetical protein
MRLCRATISRGSRPLFQPAPQGFLAFATGAAENEVFNGNVFVYVGVTSDERREEPRAKNAKRNLTRRRKARKERIILLGELCVFARDSF